MSVYFEIGNLLDAPVDYICHQVNCQGRMGSGIAKSIKEKWPVVYNYYMIKYNDTIAAGYPTNILGDIQIIDLYEYNVMPEFKQSVINMFAQESYGYDCKRYTSYDAFWTCLGEIKKQVPKGSKIGFPSKIGCGLGGANWAVIFRMIEQVLGDEYEVYIYMLEEEMHG